MQEATFSGACQDQHAGRPAPSLGWPGERKSIGATSRGKRCFWQKQISRCNKSRLGLPGAWGPGLGAGASRGSGFTGPNVLKSVLVGGRRRGGRRLKRLPRRWGLGGKRARDPAPTPPHFSMAKRKGFSPSPLLKPSNTPPKVGGYHNPYCGDP